MNNVIYMVGMVAMVIVFFLFPSGRFEPRWTVGWPSFFSSRRCWISEPGIRQQRVV